MRIAFIIALTIAAVAASPTRSTRIVGGTVTTISQYPTICALLQTRNWSTWFQNCGGTILNNRAILTAAHCIVNDQVGVWRVRVGSTWGNSGGVVHIIGRHIIHPNYRAWGVDNDIAIMHTTARINFVNNAVQPARTAWANYNLGDNQVVWAAGWGVTWFGGTNSEQLRHVQIWTVNQAVCRARYGGNIITDNMLCSGWLDVGGRDQCTADSGGPLYHNNIVVGVCSFGNECGSPRYPGVNARVSRFAAWISSNA